MDEKFYMKKAYELAKQAYDKDEVPIGAIIVDSKTGEIIAEAHNLSAHSLCSTAHAEILAINLACERLKSNRLRDMDLYVTLEPCTMCAAAISFARINKLYFGASDTKGGAVINGVEFYKSPTCHHRPIVISGVMEEECSQILKDFFQNKRK